MKLVIIEIPTALALIVAVWVFGMVPHYQDGLTAIMIAVVGLTWAFYGASGLWWHLFSQEEPPKKDEAPNAGSLAERLQEAASRVSVTFAGRQRLDAGTSDDLVQDQGDRVAPWNVASWLSTGQAVLVSLGLIGTFMGLTLGLLHALPELTREFGNPLPDGTQVPLTPEQKEQAMRAGMELLLAGAKLAFAKSLAGVWCGIVWGLRYRWLEEQQSSMLHAFKDWLDEKFPPLSPQQLLVHFLADQQQQLTALNQGVSGLRSEVHNAGAAHQRSMQQHASDLHTAVTALTRPLTEIRQSMSTEREALTRAISTERHQLGLHFATAMSEVGDRETTRALEQISDLVNQVAESLPERIGSNAGLFVTQGLQPSFEDLSRALSRLSEAGGQAIGDALQGSMAGEVNHLRSSLTEIAQLLQQLGPRVSAQIDAADARVQQGANSAASALAEAGEKASHDLRTAASHIGAETAQVEERVESIRSALAETQHIAQALRGAGLEVSERLRDVATPLVTIPPSLESVRGSIDAASIGLVRERQTAEALALHVERLAQVISEATARQQALVARSAELATQIEIVRAACSETIVAFDRVADDRHTAGSEANRQLVTTMTQFAAALESAQRDVARASTTTFAGAEALTTEAARRTAQILTDGAAKVDATLERLSAYGSEMEKGLASAREAISAIEAHAAGLKAGAAEASRPFGEVAAALGQVAPQVRQASQALQTEREALTTLSSSLKQQADHQTTSAADLAARIRQYQTLQSTMSSEWAVHVQAVDALLHRIKAAWAEAINAADTGVANNAKQIATYAQEVERATQLPRNLRQLNETLEELTDVLSDMEQSMKAKA